MSDADAGLTLHLDKLCVHRGGRPVVTDVTLEIPPAQVTTLLGANGAGKSTMVLAVAGLLRTSGGRVLLGRIHRHPERRGPAAHRVDRRAHGHEGHPARLPARGGNDHTHRPAVQVGPLVQPEPLEVVQRILDQAGNGSVVAG